MSDPADRASALTGAPVKGLRRLSGGSLSSVWSGRLASGGAVIVKEAPLAGAEADMLRAIGAAGCPAPEVLGASDGMLVMSALETGGRPDATGWRACGAAIRRLHAATGARYGWTTDHAFGAVAIPNAPCDDWPGFWAERRLMAAPEALPGDLARRVERLARRLPDLLPAGPAPALLHGDLWGGNVLWGRDGFSGVIDPACYRGDGEVDLAMLTLFGAPGPAFQEGYGALAPGWQARRPIYQLWPALVHLRLFGGGYREMVERLLAAARV